MSLAGLEAYEALAAALTPIPLSRLIAAPGGRDRDDREQDRLSDLEQAFPAPHMLVAVPVHDRVRDLGRPDGLLRSHTTGTDVHPIRTMRHSAAIPTLVRA